MLGLKVNNYTVKSLLGEGGMGAVYLAEHAVIDRKVAVKVLNRELAKDETIVHRFFNEARAANAIGHPNIVDVMDVGLLPDGLPYLIMEFLEGETVTKRLLRQGRMTLPEALAIAAQTASALVAAHGKGIVHRDLKPDNLFLVADESESVRVKLLDFGIAKLRGELARGVQQTSPGAVMGTPQYMSPEQCRGVNSELDHRSDIYSLGLILYEMLAGQPPFSGLGFGELLVAHITQPPPAPSAFNPEIPVDVEATILRALAKKPDERFASMGAFLHAIAPEAAPVFERRASRARSSPKLTPVSEARTLEAARATRPPTDPPSGQTTLAASAGAVEDEDALAPSPSRGRRGMVLVVAGVALAAVAVAAVTLKGRAPTPETPPPRPPASANAPAAGPGRLPEQVPAAPPAMKAAPPAARAVATPAPAVAKPAAPPPPAVAPAPRKASAAAARPAPAPVGRGKRGGLAARAAKAPVSFDDPAPPAAPPAAPAAPPAVTPPPSDPPTRTIIKKW